MRYRLPRWIALFAWPALLEVAHVRVPLALSRLGPRLGWQEGWPGGTNLIGLAPLAAGTALVSWALREHNAAPEEGWAIKGSLEPEYLLTDGPYRFTRNLMYVGEMAIWGGWAVLLGSAPVAGGLVVLIGISRAGVAWEEQILERRWSGQWRAYAARTSRWLTLRSATGRQWPGRAKPRLLPPEGEGLHEGTDMTALDDERECPRRASRSRNSREAKATDGRLGPHQALLPVELPLLAGSTPLTRGFMAGRDRQ